MSGHFLSILFHSISQLSSFRMDILETTQRCLETWDSGGDEQWCVLAVLAFRIRPSFRGGSRNLVAPSHSNPHDPDCNATLTTVYHALLSSTLASWSPKKSLSADALVVFVRSVLDHLPSSSAGTDKSPNVAAFGEILVDIVWAIDSELEEILTDAKNAASTADQGELSAATVAQAVKAKDNAEADKGTLVALVRGLLVCVLYFLSLMAIVVCRVR